MRAVTLAVMCALAMGCQGPPVLSDAQTQWCAAHRPAVTASARTLRIKIPDGVRIHFGNQLMDVAVLRNLGSTEDEIWAAAEYADDALVLAVLKLSAHDDYVKACQKAFAEQ
jgi:hypothetical protein